MLQAHACLRSQPASWTSGTDPCATSWTGVTCSSEWAGFAGWGVRFRKWLSSVILTVSVWTHLCQPTCTHPFGCLHRRRGNQHQHHSHRGNTPLCSGGRHLPHRECISSIGGKCQLLAAHLAEGWVVKVTATRQRCGPQGGPQAEPDPKEGTQRHGRHSTHEDRTAGQADCAQASKRQTGHTWAPGHRPENRRAGQTWGTPAPGYSSTWALGKPGHSIRDWAAPCCRASQSLDLLR
jgi:hypothetical protein